MKSSGLPVLVPLCFWAAACSKTEGPVSCTAPRAKIPASLSFSGFTASELRTFVMGTYAGGGTFGTRLRQDTLRTDSISIVDGKAYTNTAGLAPLEAGFDYQIFVPATAQTFKITGLQRTGDSLYRYTSNTTCNLKGTLFWPPDTALVNGKAQSLEYFMGPSLFLYPVR